MTLPIPCVIVAGGKSSRMGSDKALLPFGSSQTLTQFQMERLKPFFKSVHVSCKESSKFHFKANFIEDVQEFESFSPLVALYSILREFDTSVAILSVDTPFADERVFEKLYKSLDSDTDIVIARSPYGSHQMCGIYKPRASHAIKNQIINDNHKIRAMFKKLKVKYVDFADDNFFANINHPHEYENAKGVHARHAH